MSRPSGMAAAGRSHCRLDAAHHVGRLRCAAERGVHHPHPPRPGSQAQADQGGDDGGVGRGRVFRRVVVHADVGLDDHLIAGANETLDAAQSGNRRLRDLRRIGAPGDGQVGLIAGWGRRLPATRGLPDGLSRSTPGAQDGCGGRGRAGQFEKLSSA
jgi:hypothetical protein